MKAPLRLFVALSLAGLSGCLALPDYLRSPGSPASAAPCAAGFLNTKGPISWVNASVGQDRGFKQHVASLSGTTEVRLADLLALDLPGNAAGGPASMSCYATAHFQDGTTQDGVVSFQDPGGNVPLKVIWIDRVAVEQARATYEQRRDKQQQETIAYSAKLQACTFLWKVAVQAKSLLASGWSVDRTADQLVTEYAYGPQGQAYRNSEEAEEAIRRVTAAVAMPVDVRATNHIQDYASQAFLSSCSSKVARDTVARLSISS